MEKTNLLKLYLEAKKKSQNEEVKLLIRSLGFEPTSSRAWLSI